MCLSVFSTTLQAQKVGAIERYHSALDCTRALGAGLRMGHFNECTEKYSPVVYNTSGADICSRVRRTVGTESAGHRALYSELDSTRVLGAEA